MLKYKLDKTAHEKLDDAQKGLYKQEGDFFILQIEGGPEGGDTAGLKRKNEELLTKLDKQKEKNAELQAELDESNSTVEQLRTTQSGNEENVAALKESWQKKYDKDIAERDATIESLRGNVQGLTSDAEAVRIASEIALEGSADVLLPHIAKRLTTEFTDDGPRVTVVGPDGKPSALTTQELADEFKNDQRFAAIIKGTSAGGSGHGGGKGGEAATKTVKRSEFDAMSQADRASFSKDGGQVVDD